VNYVYVYDGDGNRVSEIVGGATTKYVVDTVNPTGYAQVVDELRNGALVRTYSYGLERISETQPINSTLTTSFYGYDGHGSVRFLTNTTGAITDTYDYDAFGNLINSTGSTPNNYLFAGEQYDPVLGLYYKSPIPEHEYGSVLDDGCLGRETFSPYFSTQVPLCFRFSGRQWRSFRK
jgi:hypothetical protein